MIYTHALELRIKALKIEIESLEKQGFSEDFIADYRKALSDAEYVYNNELRKEARK